MWLDDARSKLEGVVEVIRITPPAVLRGTHDGWCGCGS